jgi:protoporphyrin/coproporphyrin ferrochelatase
MNFAMRKGIILMAYGSPERDEDIEPYYTHIRGGRKPTDEELKNLKSRYRAIGGHSPLLKITNSTAKKLEERLAERGEKTSVYAGMKHWHPFVSETFDQIVKDGVTDLVAIALAPHYSKVSIGGYQDSVRKANEERGGKVNVTCIDQWHLNRVFLEKWKERITEVYEKKFKEMERSKVFFLFTAHSLPERILSWKDPYKDQLLETMNKLATVLKLDGEQYGLAFQSAGHTSEPWLAPDILDKIKELRRKGWSSVLVIPIGFVSDHLEILFDIDVEAKDLAKELGMKLERTESFNDGDDFVDVLVSVVQE